MGKLSVPVRKSACVQGSGKICTTGFTENHGDHRAASTRGTRCFPSLRASAILRDETLSGAIGTRGLAVWTRGKGHGRMVSWPRYRCDKSIPFMRWRRDKEGANSRHRESGAQRAVPGRMGTSERNIPPSSGKRWHGTRGAMKEASFGNDASGAPPFRPRGGPEDEGWPGLIPGHFSSGQNGPLRPISIQAHLHSGPSPFRPISIQARPPAVPRVTPSARTPPPEARRTAAAPPGHARW